LAHLLLAPLLDMVLRHLHRLHHVILHSVSQVHFVIQIQISVLLVRLDINIFRIRTLAFQSPNYGVVQYVQKELFNDTNGVLSTRLVPYLTMKKRLNINNINNELQSSGKFLLGDGLVNIKSKLNNTLLDKTLNQLLNYLKKNQHI
jgi:hypothetical protein